MREDPVLKNINVQNTSILLTKNKFKSGDYLEFCFFFIFYFSHFSVELLLTLVLLN